jgi:hypothetical protein
MRWAVVEFLDQRARQGAASTSHSSKEKNRKEQAAPLKDPLDSIIFWLSSVRTRASDSVPFTFLRFLSLCLFEYSLLREYASEWETRGRQVAVLLVGTHIDEIKSFDSNIAKRITEHMNTRCAAKVFLCSSRACAVGVQR